MVTSKTKNESYFSYLLTEILMIFCVTFLATAILVFYFSMRATSRHKSDTLEYLLSNPLIYSIICLFPVFISVFILILFRKRKYIIGFEFSEDLSHVKLLYRGINKNILDNIELLIKDLNFDSFYEKGFLFVYGYKGIRIQDKIKNIQLDFVTNNFVWEEQPREKLLFLEIMEQISESNKDSSITMQNQK